MRHRVSTQTKPSIVSAHGLWADGSCYSKVIPTLHAEGLQVVAAQNPLDSLEGDVATVRRALGRVNSLAYAEGSHPRLHIARVGDAGMRER